MSNGSNNIDTATEEFVIDWQKIAGDLAGALAACVTQIDQMKGLFDDEDGTIQEALNVADEAADVYHHAVRNDGSKVTAKVSGTATQT